MILCLVLVGDWLTTFTVTASPSAMPMRAVSIDSEGALLYERSRSSDRGESTAPSQSRKLKRSDAAEMFSDPVRYAGDGEEMEVSFFETESKRPCRGRDYSYPCAPPHMEQNYFEQHYNRSRDFVEKWNNDDVVSLFGTETEQASYIEMQNKKLKAFLVTQDRMYTQIEATIRREFVMGFKAETPHVPQGGELFFPNEGHEFIHWYARMETGNDASYDEQLPDAFVSDDGVPIYLPRLREIPEMVWNRFKALVKRTPGLPAVLSQIAGNQHAMRALFRYARVLTNRRKSQLHREDGNNASSFFDSGGDDLLDGDFYLASLSDKELEENLIFENSVDPGDDLGDANRWNLTADVAGHRTAVSARNTTVTDHAERSFIALRARSEKWGFFKKVVKKVASHPVTAVVLGSVVVKAVSRRVNKAMDTLGSMMPSWGALLDLRKAYKSLKDLFKCLSEEADDKFRIGFILQFVGDRVKTPDKLLEDLVDLYVSEPLSELGPVLEETMTKISDKMSTAAGKGEEKITKDAVLRHLDMAEELITDIGNMANFKAFGCVNTHFLLPSWKILKNSFVDPLLTVVLDFQQLWNDAVARAIRFIANRVKGILEGCFYSLQCQHAANALEILLEKKRRRSDVGRGGRELDALDVDSPTYNASLSWLDRSNNGSISDGFPTKRRMTVRQKRRAARNDELESSTDQLAHLRKEKSDGTYTTDDELILLLEDPAFIRTINSTKVARQSSVGTVFRRSASRQHRAGNSPTAIFLQQKGKRFPSAKRKQTSNLQKLVRKRRSDWDKLMDWTETIVHTVLDFCAEMGKDVQNIMFSLGERMSQYNALSASSSVGDSPELVSAGATVGVSALGMLKAVTISVVREWLREAILIVFKEVVEPVITSTCDMITTLIEFIKQIADGLAGLIPEAGAAIFAVIAAAVGTMQNSIASKMKDYTVQVTLRIVDYIMDMIFVFVEMLFQSLSGGTGDEGSAATAGIQWILDLYAPVVDVLMPIVELIFPDVAHKLEECDGIFRSIGRILKAIVCGEKSVRKKMNGLTEKIEEVRAEDADSVSNVEAFGQDTHDAQEDRVREEGGSVRTDSDQGVLHAVVANGKTSSCMDRQGSDPCPITDIKIISDGVDTLR